MPRSIRTGIVGVGNNASALVQGVVEYQNGSAGVAAAGRQGIRFPRLCGYDVGNLEFVSAFDVDARKIGKELGEAIWCPPNCYPRVFDAPVQTGVRVSPAPVLDGVPDFLRELVDVASDCRAADSATAFDQCVEVLRDTGTEVLINFLPSGSDEATRFFARVAAAAKAAYINCTPTPAVHAPDILTLFERAGVPLLGDDLESQFGSSMLHRTILKALQDRGLEVVHSYQVNLGGNADFKNLSHRGDAKKRSKFKAISPTATDCVDIVPSGGFVRGLGDNKVGYITVDGRGWLSMPVTIELKLKVQDSSNAAGVVIDLVRLAKGAADRGLGGHVPFSYYFKNPLGEKLNTTEALMEIQHFDAELAYS